MGLDGLVAVTPPIPTPIYRLMHIDSFEVCLKRGRLHCPNQTPDDGLGWRHIHDAEVQAGRMAKTVFCEPAPRRAKGVVHDYVPFYFGVHSPMLLNLKTGRVSGYSEGQEPLVYLRTTAQRVVQAGYACVFSDGHGLATFTRWYDDLGDLDKIDWTMVHAQYWADNAEDPDRQRRKQAEFMVRGECGLDIVEEVGVYGEGMRKRVEALIASLKPGWNIPVSVRRGWYYP